MVVVGGGDRCGRLGAIMPVVSAPFAVVVAPAVVRRMWLDVQMGLRRYRWRSSLTIGLIVRDLFGSCPSA